MHANALPKKSETTDAEISAYVDLHGCVVFTKDEDFCPVIYCGAHLASWFTFAPATGFVTKNW